MEYLMAFLSITVIFIIGALWGITRFKKVDWGEILSLFISIFIIMILVTKVDINKSEYIIKPNQNGYTITDAQGQSTFVDTNNLENFIEKDNL